MVFSVASEPCSLKIAFIRLNSLKPSIGVAAMTPLKQIQGRVRLRFKGTLILTFVAIRKNCPNLTLFKRHYKKSRDKIEILQITTKND